MLRREFIKNSSLVVGGIILGTGIIMADTTDKHRKERRRIKRHYHLHGHARSGCATPPEMQSAMEQGIYATPEI